MSRPAYLPSTPQPPQDQHNGLAKFLEAKGMPEQALEVATDAGQ